MRDDATRDARELREQPPQETEALDVADFTCPECKQSFRIVHVNRNLHRFVSVKNENQA